jgi:hypothetical protein
MPKVKIIQANSSNHIEPGSSSKFQKTKNAVKNSLILSSWHGIPRIASSKHIINLIFWVVLTMLATGGCVFFVFTSVNEYENYETIIHTRFHKEKSLNFPAVYICPSKDVTLEKLIFQCLFENTDLNCRDYTRPIELTNNQGDIKKCFVFNSGKKNAINSGMIFSFKKISIQYERKQLYGPSSRPFEDN